tara:strand:- start:126 stop:2261 length:2136 start_codon:yes stop_codon:yes gene_type:complete
MKISSKLENFPTPYYISLEESVDRQESLKSQFSEYGITDLNGIICKRFYECDDKVTGEQLHILEGGTIGCIVSHLNAIKKWYENTSEDYGFFCEDDLSLESVQYWNFTWEDFVNNLPSDWECIQLCCVRSSQIDVKMRERSMSDWSATVYMITRNYAKKIIDRYIREDSYDLTIYGTNFYPMPENVLFYGIGKVYSVDLFVENQKFNSTFTETVGIEGGIKEHHTESYEHVINWWKNNSETTVYKLLGLSDPSNELIDFCMNAEDAEKCYNLAEWYYNQNHYAPAFSFYLRASERSDNIDLIYTCLIKCSICSNLQGRRKYADESLLLTAIQVNPKKPTAYYLLSDLYYKQEDYKNSYMYANLGLTCYDNLELDDVKDDQESIKHLLLYVSALSGWHWGKNDHCSNTMLKLKNHSECWDLFTDEQKKTIEEKIYEWKLIDSDDDNSINNNYVKHDIVIQGPIHELTESIVKDYLKLPFVNKIFVSTWNDQTFEYVDDRVELIKNDYPITPGTCNKNLQIVSTLSGLKKCTSKYTIKMRSDQKYSNDTMLNHYKFFVDNDGLNSDKLFVGAVYPKLLFHPRDHIFWGKTDNLLKMFDIPIEYNSIIDKVRLGKYELAKYFNHFTRPETYLGAHYISKYDERVKMCLIYPENNLYDGCMYWDNNYKLSSELMPKYFEVFPHKNTDIQWKLNLNKVNMPGEEYYEDDPFNKKST